MNWLQKIWQALFPPKVPTHVNVPDVLVGSPDWLPAYAFEPDGNWWPFFSMPYHTQEENLGNKGNLFEDNCELQSGITIIEAILNNYISKATPGDKTLQLIKNYYCNAKGQVKLSVRYASKMANVQLGIGTSVQTAWDSFALHGVVPESVYPDPGQPFTWQEYMQDLPAGIEAYGAYSLTFFKIIWTALKTNGWGTPNIELIKTALQSCPVQLTGSIGNIDKNGVEQFAGLDIYQHARVIASLDDVNKEIDILDNYPDRNGLMNRRLAQTFPCPCLVMCQVKII